MTQNAKMIQIICNETDCLNFLQERIQDQENYIFTFVDAKSLRDIDNLKILIQELDNKANEYICFINLTDNQQLIDLLTENQIIPSQTFICQNNQSAEQEQLLSGYGWTYSLISSQDASDIANQILSSIAPSQEASNPYQNILQAHQPANTDDQLENQEQQQQQEEQISPYTVLQQQTQPINSPPRINVKDVMAEQLQHLNQQITSMQNGEDLQQLDQQLVEENQRLRQINEELLLQLQKYQNTKNTPRGFGINQMRNIAISPKEEQQQIQIQQRQQIALEKGEVAFDNISKPLSRQLICQICLEPFKQPVSLPCGHSFCLRCLDLYESHQHKSNQEFDTEYQCPGLVANQKDVCGFHQCAYTYQETPKINVQLQKQISDALGQNEKLDIGDYVYIFEDDFGQILSIETVLYDVVDHKIVQMSIQQEEENQNKNITYITLATIRTLNDNIVKTEIFNLTKLYPQFTQVSTRIKEDDYLIKIQYPTKLDIKPNSYYYQVQKFSQINRNSYCQQESQIYQIVGFQANQFILRDKMGILKREANLDGYFSLNVKKCIDPISDEKSICPSCHAPVKIEIESTCGCSYCLFCLQKLIRNNIPCFNCDKKLGFQGLYPCPNEEYQAFLHKQCLDNQRNRRNDDNFNQIDELLDQNQLCLYNNQIFFIHQILNTEEAVLQKMNGECQIQKLLDLTPIDFTMLQPVLRPKNGDICIQLNGNWTSYGFVQNNQIISQFKKSQLSYHNILVRNIRLVKETEIYEQMCPLCRQLVKRPTKMQCGHIACKTCVILATMLNFQCTECHGEIKFDECEILDDEQVDIGTICVKRVSRINSYGSQFGFIRQIGEESHDIAFSSVTQKLEQYDINYISDQLITKTSQAPSPNDLAYITQSENGLNGVYCLVLNINQKQQTYKVLTEVGVMIESVQCLFADVNIQKNSARRK